MKKEIIDLELHRTPGSKVFTGRDRGISVRKLSEIDRLESENDIIVVKIPKDIMSINPSFLEEFLFNVVTKLGEKKFNEKIIFETESTRYDISIDLEEAVERILRNDNALSRN